MVKKTSKKTSRKNSEIEETKVQEVEPVEELYESDMVKLKKENQKAMESAVKSMSTQVKQKIEPKQVISAVKALQNYFENKHTTDKKKQLLADEDGDIHMSFTLGQVPMRQTPRPLKISVPKPFNSQKHDTRICIIVKDPESDFKAQIAALKVPCIAEVIGFDRLKRDFHQFKDKRQLLRDYDIFLADIRIYKMLPDMLGKEFYQKKAYPCPIKVHGFEAEVLKKQLNEASECAYFQAGNGPNYSMKIGKVSQEAADVNKNVQEALSQVLGYVTCWDSISFDKISQMTLRVGDSIELPFYNHFDQEDVDAYMKSQ